MKRQTVWRRVYEGRKGTWALSHDTVVDRGLRNAYFAEQGLLSLYNRFEGIWAASHAPGEVHGYPGVWTTIGASTTAEPARWFGGRVGDLLAVALPAACGSLDLLFGKLVVLCQGGCYTHLGVVRSSENLPAIDPHEPYKFFVWVEILAMVPDGLDIDAGVPNRELPWFMPGANFNQIDHAKALAADGLRAALRDKIWAAFSVPAPVDLNRPAVRP